MKLINHNTLTLEQYIEAKLKMLRTEFKVFPKCFEVDYLKACKNEIQADNYVRYLLKTYL